MSWQPLEKIVVPIDFSASSRPSVCEAMDMAKRPDCVYVLHVIPKQGLVSRFAQVAIPEEEQMESARDYLLTWLASNEIAGVRPHVVIGDPGEMIVHFACEADANLIVIPSHGYHGFKRAFLGSVTERVVRHAECPVYVLRRN